MPRSRMVVGNWKLHVGIVEHDVTPVLSAHGKFGGSLNAARSRLLSHRWSGPRLKPTAAP